MSIDYAEAEQRIMASETNDYREYLINEINEEQDPRKRNVLKNRYFAELNMKLIS